jgi:hypothetical protein
MSLSAQVIARAFVRARWYVRVYSRESKSTGSDLLVDLGR